MIFLTFSPFRQRVCNKLVESLAGGNKLNELLNREQLDDDLKAGSCLM